MKRIVYDIPRWNIYLHRRERKLPLVSHNDSAVLRFQDEVFDRLFAGDAEELSKRLVDKKNEVWAKTSHGICDDLPHFEDIIAKCKGHAGESALATNWIMELLAPKITKPSRQQQQQQQAQQEAADALEHVQTDESEDKAEHEMRPEDASARAERLAEMLADDARLKKIAELAGRFKAIVLTKQKTKVKHESDELADIEQGGELSRLLPSELVKFLSPRLQMCVKRDLLEKKCLQYSMTAMETLGRGPLILCLDKSSSMEGDKDIWASAIALALLDMAHRHKRVFILLGFDNEVFQKVVVRVGKNLPKEQLCVAPRGGTDIKEVLDLALNAVETRKIMHRADIILITDGESDTSSAEEIRERALANDVSILGIGIGVTPEAILPWCDEAHTVTDMGGIDDETATALFGK